MGTFRSNLLFCLVLLGAPIVLAGDASALPLRKVSKPKNPTVVSFTVNTGDGATQVVKNTLTLPASVAAQGVSVTLNLTAKSTKPTRVILSTNGVLLKQTRAPFSFFRVKVGQSSFRGLSAGTFTLTATPFIKVATRKGLKLKALKAATLVIVVQEASPENVVVGGATVTPTPTPTIQPRLESPFKLPTAVPAEVKAALPLYQQWEDNMKNFGASYCDQAAILERSTDDGGLWNFDGLRAYHNIASVTGDSMWLVCAGYVRQVYREYVLKNDGVIPGRRVFPAGLLMDWRVTGDEQSKRAVVLLAKNSVFSFYGGNADIQFSVETANLINAYLASEEVGQPQSTNVPVAVAFALGHLERWQQGISGDFEPYAVALTLDALINWHIQTRDPRIPPALKAAADWLWSNYWNPTTKSFPAIVCQLGSKNPDCQANYTGADTNLLFAPAYAWIGKQSGDEIEKDRAKQLFTGGIEGGFLERPKQFAQSYSLIFRLFDRLP